MPQAQQLVTLPTIDVARPEIHDVDFTKAEESFIAQATEDAPEQTVEVPVAEVPVAEAPVAEASGKEQTTPETTPEIESAPEPKQPEHKQPEPKQTETSLETVIPTSSSDDDGPDFEIVQTVIVQEHPAIGETNELFPPEKPRDDLTIMQEAVPQPQSAKATEPEAHTPLETPAINTSPADVDLHDTAPEAAEPQQPVTETVADAATSVDAGLMQSVQAKAEMEDKSKRNLNITAQAEAIFTSNEHEQEPEEEVTLEEPPITIIPSVALAGTIPPSFDVVHITQEGSAVIAGRAEPNSKVQILDADTVIATVSADEHGEWLYLPHRPLLLEARELGLRSIAKNGDADPILSEDVVLLVPLEDENIYTDTAPDQPIIATAAAEAFVDQPQIVSAGLSAHPDEEISGPEISHATLALLTKRDGSGEAKLLFEPETMPQFTVPVPSEKPQLIIGGRTIDLAKDTAFSNNATDKTTKKLSIDLFTYGRGGRLNIGGAAPHRGVVEVSIDGEKTYQTGVDPSLRWRFSPGTDVKPGSYRLIAQIIDEDGIPGERVSVPFEVVDPQNKASRTVATIERDGKRWRIIGETDTQSSGYRINYRTELETY